MIAIVLAALVAAAPPALAQNAASPAPASSPAAEDPKITDRVKTEFAAWQKGQIVRAHYTQQANESFSDTTIAAISEQLRTLGDLKSATFKGASTESGSTVYAYRVSCAKGDVSMTLALDKTGHISGVAFRPADKPNAPAA